MVNTIFILYFFLKIFTHLYKVTGVLVLQVTAAAWLSSNFYLKIASFTYSIINTKSFSYFTEIKNYNKLTHGIKYLSVFSASHHPLALPLRKSFRYIPRSVVSAQNSARGARPLPAGPRPAPRAPLAGDFSLTFIARPLPGGRAAIGSLPQ